MAIIPARYGSTRFPGKALTDIAGMSMIMRVYRQVAKSLVDQLVVATDHEEIYNHVIGFGGNAVMTSTEHLSGTDRCAEAAITYGQDEFGFIINVQGDEPFLHYQQINLLVTALFGGTQIATLAKRVDDEKDLFSPDVPKVVIDKDSNARYFSRQTIPYLQNIDKKDWLASNTFYKHIGIYAYREDVLQEITKLEPTFLEKAESLEQLRWLENGYKVRVMETPHDSHGIDRPEDVAVAIKKFLP